jgi:ABC-type amino acid transport substrate-binding protein|tara:strand:+ start:1985 stop:2743 length:759 start_codon:yes stop_codon:yes gene_type:complete
MKNVVIYSLLCIFLSAFSCISKVSAEEKSTALHFDLGENSGWVPYRTGQDGSQSGILSELTLLIEQHTTIEFQTVNWPMKRAEQALKKGIIDFDFVCTAWFDSGNYGEKFVISDPILEVEEYVVTLKGNEHLFPTLDKIHNKRIGTIAGYFYFDDQKFTRVNFRDEESLMQALKYKRVDAVILEHETAKHWAKIHDVDIKFAAEHTIGKLLIRLNKTKKSMLPAINLALKKIKNSGQLQNILDKYGVEAEIY